MAETFGGQGKFLLPKTHRAGMQVPDGGACCNNCRFLDAGDGLATDEDPPLCKNKYWVMWSTPPKDSPEYKRGLAELHRRADVARVERPKEFVNDEIPVAPTQYCCDWYSPHPNSLDTLDEQERRGVTGQAW